jgi:hypothetical protein
VSCPSFGTASSKQRIYFFGMPDDETELELTFKHDGRNYDLGTGYGHIAIASTTWTRRGRSWK